MGYNYSTNQVPFNFKAKKKKPKGYEERQAYCKACREPFLKLNGQAKYCYDCKDPHIRAKKLAAYLREHPEESA